MITISFYLETKNEPHIHTMYNMISNPFKVGDVINLTVEEILPRKLDDEIYSKEAIKILVENNLKQRKMFHLKEIKLIKENKYIELESGKFNIEYHCELIDEK